MKLRIIQSVSRCGEPYQAGVARRRPIGDRSFPLLAKGGVFAFLTHPAAFNAVAVGRRGRTLIWHDPAGEEIDLCADALWRLAHEGATEAA